MALELATRAPDFAERFARLLAQRGEDARAADAVVAAIVEDVQRRGDEAGLEFTQKFDRVALTQATMAISALPALKIPYAQRPMSSAAMPAIFTSPIGSVIARTPSGPFFGPAPK